MTAEKPEVGPILDGLKESGEKLAQANSYREYVMNDLVDKFQTARAAGVSITTISKLTGLSRQSLHKISKKLSAAQDSV